MGPCHIFEKGEATHFKFCKRLSQGGANASIKTCTVVRAFGITNGKSAGKWQISTPTSRKTETRWTAGYGIKHSRFLLGPPHLKVCKN